MLRAALRDADVAVRGGLWADLRDGLRSFGRRPEVRVLLASSTAAVLFAGMTNVGKVLLAREVLGTAGTGLAALVAVHGFGTVLGGFGNGRALVHDRLLLGAAVPEPLHGRVFAVQKALTSLAFAGSFVAASVLISVGGVQTTFAIAAAGMLAVIALSSPRLRGAWPAPAAAVAATA